MLSEPVPNLASIIPGSCFGPRGALPWERALPKAARFTAGGTRAAVAGQHVCHVPRCQAPTWPQPGKLGEKHKNPTSFQGSALLLPARLAQLPSTPPEHPAWELQSRGRKMPVPSKGFRGIIHFLESLDPTERNSNFRRAVAEPGLSLRPALSSPSFSRVQGGGEKCFAEMSR